MELNKKVKIFGKQIPAVLIALVAIAGLASAGLLSYYGKVTGTASVSQSVLVDDKSVPDSMSLPYTITGVKGGETFTTNEHKITDQSSADAPITLTTQITEATCPSGAECTEGSAIESTYYTFSEVIGTADGTTSMFSFVPAMTGATNVKAICFGNTVECAYNSQTQKYDCTFGQNPPAGALVTGFYDVNGLTASGTVTGGKSISFTFSAKTKVNAIPGDYTVTTTVSPA